MPRWPEPFSWPRNGGGPRSGPDAEYWRRVVDAEMSRGNEWRRIDGDIHDTRGYLGFHYPMDLDAILAEFELGEGIVAAPGPCPALHYLRDGQVEWGLTSLTAIPGWWQRRRRAAWWRTWNAAPRPRVLLVNPYGG